MLVNINIAEEVLTYIFMIKIILSIIFGQRRRMDLIKNDSVEETGIKEKLNATCTIQKKN